MVWKKKGEEDDRKNKGKQHCGYGDAYLIKKQGGIEKKNDCSWKKKMEWNLMVGHRWLQWWEYGSNSGWVKEEDEEMLILFYFFKKRKLLFFG